MACIYRIMPKLGDMTKEETYIGFNDHDDPLFRVKKHMRSAYGLDSESSGKGSALIGKYGASDIQVDVGDEQDLYGVNRTSFVEFQRTWKFGNYKQALLEFAEICGILYYDELGGGGNIGIGDQGGMSYSINVLPNTDFIKNELSAVMESFGVSIEDLDARNVGRPDDFGTVSFHVGDTVDMKMKLFAPETYIYSRALCYLMTAYTFFRKKVFAEVLKECAISEFQGVSYKNILDNYVNKCRHECILMGNRNPALSALAKAGAIYVNFKLDDVIQQICDYIAKGAVLPTVQKGYKEGKNVIDKVGVNINKLKKNGDITDTTQEFQHVMKFNRNVYVYASVSNVAEPKWYTYAKEYIKAHLQHRPRYDKQVAKDGKAISGEAFKKTADDEIARCPIHDNNESGFGIIADPLEPVFSNYFQRSDKSLRAQTLRRRMYERMQSVGKIQKTASLIRKGDIYYRQSMTLWLKPGARFLKKSSDEVNFSIGAEDRYTLSYVSAYNTYGYKYWFKNSTGAIIEHSYANDLKCGKYLYG